MKERWENFIGRIPRVELGFVHQESKRNPVMTYFLIFFPTVFLAGCGLVMGFSASAITSIAAGESPYVAFARPFIIIVVSLILAFFIQFLRESFWVRYAIPLFIASLFVQGLVFTPLGMNQGGNRNWIRVPGISSLQPSELLKIALIILVAFMVSRPGAQIGSFRQMLIVAGAPIAMALALVLIGRDLGTTLVLTACAAGALWVAGVPKRWFAFGTLMAVPVLAFLVFQNETRVQRILAVLPGSAKERSLDKPEQIDHALWALGSGGLWGLGAGASREKWQYLQAAHTDFILAITGEEFGLLGTMAILVSLGLLVWGMVRVCQDSTSYFAQVVSGGVAAWISMQTMMNVMSVTGVGPVIGVPLPLVSYGGSSFLFTVSAVAIVASFARDNAGMRMKGAPDEASAGRDPRKLPKRRSARGGRESRFAIQRVSNLRRSRREKNS